MTDDTDNHDDAVLDREGIDRLERQYAESLAAQQWTNDALLRAAADWRRQVKRGAEQGFEAGRGAVWTGYMAELTGANGISLGDPSMGLRSNIESLWIAIEALAATGITVGAHYETGAGPTTAHGASGVERLREVLRGERPSAA